MSIRDETNTVPVTTFQDLTVWKKAHELTLAIYRHTAQFPREEMFGITSQMRHASASTASNIVEGSRRSYRADFARFLKIAQGSNEEVKYFIILSRDLKYLGSKDASELLRIADEIGAMLHAMSRRLNSEL